MGVAEGSVGVGALFLTLWGLWGSNSSLQVWHPYLLEILAGFASFSVLRASVLVLLKEPQINRKSLPLPWTRGVEGAG